MRKSFARKTFRATQIVLTPGERYLFQVNAVGTAGTSDWSNAGSRIII